MAKNLELCHLRELLVWCIWNDCVFMLIATRFQMQFVVNFICFCDLFSFRCFKSLISICCFAGIVLNLFCPTLMLQGRCSEIVGRCPVALSNSVWHLAYDNKLCGIALSSMHLDMHVDPGRSNLTTKSSNVFQRFCTCVDKIKFGDSTTCTKCNRQRTPRLVELVRRKAEARSCATAVEEMLASLPCVISWLWG